MPLIRQAKYNRAYDSATAEHTKIHRNTHAHAQNTICLDPIVYSHRNTLLVLLDASSAAAVTPRLRLRSRICCHAFKRPLRYRNPHSVEAIVRYNDLASCAATDVARAFNSVAAGDASIIRVNSERRGINAVPISFLPVPFFVFFTFLGSGGERGGGAFGGRGSKQ